MTKWIIEVSPGVYSIVGAKGFVPKNMVCLAPDGEEVDWLIIDDVQQEDGSFKKTAIVNQTLKDEIIAQRHADKLLQAAKEQDQIEVKKRIAILDFGKELKARVALVNNSKGWTDTKFLEYMTNQDIRSLSAMLNDGYLTMAKGLLETANLSAFYTTEEIDNIKTLIDDFILSQGA